MKTLTGIEQPIPYPDEQATEQQRKEFPSIKRLLNIMTVNVTPNNPDDSLNLWQAGLKLRSAGENVDLEEAEFRSVQSHALSNRMQWSNWLYHHVMEAFKNAEGK